MPKKQTTKRQVSRLNAALAPVLEQFRPPEELTLSQWAAKRRYLSRETSAEPGPWRNERTPYLCEVMDAFTDPKINRIVMAAASQVGKSEVILNAIGQIIDQDPASILFVQPSLDDAKKFSRLRIAPMIRDCKALKSKVSDIKTRDSGNTILQKSFPGGMLTITGSNSPSALASTPARYIFGDERDRWAASAGTEGDPWELAKARQATFYNAKAIEVSTPTIKGASNIEASFYEGTQERWCHQCPECGAFHEIKFADIRFQHETRKIRGQKVYKLTAPVHWLCPSCAFLSTEESMRRQPAKWIAENPDAVADGIRSFWLNAFVSPWTPWSKIVLKFLQAQGDTQKLQVVYNTLLGELWEDRGEMEDEDEFLARREDYGKTADGAPVDLPDGVLLLTCGVDTQDNRLEYEVVGHGRYGETWGIQRGFFPGVPDTAEPWKALDAVIGKTYKFKSGRGLRISATFVDSGGHYTQHVYAACKARYYDHVYAIKGANTENAPFVKPPTRVPIGKDKSKTCWLYSIGVDAGKTMIMSSLRVQEPGPKYCHFPQDPERGYDHEFFSGLLSEKLVLTGTKAGKRWRWERIAGHTHNEELDCRNYALAARQIITVDFDEEERRLHSPKVIQRPQPRKKKPKTSNQLDDW